MTPLLIRIVRVDGQLFAVAESRTAPGVFAIRPDPELGSDWVEIIDLRPGGPGCDCLDHQMATDGPSPAHRAHAAAHLPCRWERAVAHYQLAVYLGIQPRRREAAGTRR
jgi:hypothetical protein